MHSSRNLNASYHDITRVRSQSDSLVSEPVDMEHNKSWSKSSNKPSPVSLCSWVYPIRDDWFAPWSILVERHPDTSRHIPTKLLLAHAAKLLVLASLLSAVFSVGILAAPEFDDKSKEFEELIFGNAICGCVCFYIDHLEFGRCLLFSCGLNNVLLTFPQAGVWALPFGRCGATCWVVYVVTPSGKCWRRWPAPEEPLERHQPSAAGRSRHSKCQGRKPWNQSIQ